MRQGSSRRGKPHCEAFPAVDILEVSRSLRAGSRSCVWQDKDSKVIGEGRLLTLDADRLVLQYAFCGSANIAKADGVLEVNVSGTRRNPHVVRYSFHCSACQRRVQALFYVSGSWACRQCHDLVYLKQRLAGVNKKLHYRDEVAAELAKLPEDERHTRWFHNEQRHVDRIDRELVEAGYASLPDELLYRTTCKWLQSAEGVAVISESQLANEDLTEPHRGLAYFKLAEASRKPVVPCEFIGSRILDQPILPFLRGRKAAKFAELEDDIAEGRVIVPLITAEALATMLADRLFLQSLVITSDWSDVVERVSEDEHSEQAISARYEGDPTLWRVGPGVVPATTPLRAILDAGVVTLQVRLPKRGLPNAIADLRTAAAKLEEGLLKVQAKSEEFNAARLHAARRRVRYDLTHKRRPPGYSRRLWVKGSV